MTARRRKTAFPAKCPGTSNWACNTRYEVKYNLSHQGRLRQLTINQARVERRNNQRWAGNLPIGAAFNRVLLFVGLMIAIAPGRMPGQPAGWKPALHGRTLPRFGLDDFNFRVPGPDLLLEPVAGFCFAMAQEHCAGRDLANEIKQFVAIGVGGQVEVLHFTAFGDLAGAPAQDKGSARLGGLEP